jgi:hypothetical protein
MDNDQALFIDLLGHHLVARGLDFLHFRVMARIDIDVWLTFIGHDFIPLNYGPTMRRKRIPDQGPFCGVWSSLIEFNLRNDGLKAMTFRILTKGNEEQFFDVAHWQS